MKYTLLYTRRAEKDIKRLTDNPIQRSEKLSDPKIGTYRYRIGDYRVIFDLEGDNVVILRVGHRREIYRKI